MLALETLFSFFSLQFQIISNTVRMHALETLFSKFSLQFQIVSNSTRMYALETLFNFFSVVPNRFKYRQNAFFKHIVFIFFKSISLNILLLLAFHVA